VIFYRGRRLVRLAAKSLWRHRLRSFLTMLGIIFGVGSVVAMLAVGEGESQEAQERFGRLGVRNLIVRSVKPPEPTAASTTRSWVIDYGLTQKDIRAVRETVPHVARVTARRDFPTRLWNGGRSLMGLLIGVEPNYRDIANVVVARGRFLEEGDDSNVCVLGSSVAETLFVGEDPLAGTVRVASDYYRVVGVLEKRGTAPASGAGASGDEDTAAFVPIDAHVSRIGSLLASGGSGQMTRERVEVHQMIAEAETAEDVPATASALRALLEHRHGKRDDVRVTVPLELLEEAARTKRNSAIVLGSIAAISLLVGGIGIMNIMLASVTERTREIGIRRALGARRQDIVRQFLAETVLLSGSGGAIGCLLGVLLPYLITEFFGMKTEVVPSFVVLALSVSAAVGVVFGLYPASRAAGLDPVEALRHD
jgi:putative ABC transport system permease protein